MQKFEIHIQKPQYTGTGTEWSITTKASPSRSRVYQYTISAHSACVPILIPLCLRLVLQPLSTKMLTSVQSRCPTGVTPFQQSPCRLIRRNAVLQRPAVCSAQRPQLDQAESAVRRFAMPLTAAVAAALLISAGSPDEALAARSGGRVGGSSFRSARPAPSAPQGGG